MNILLTSVGRRSYLVKYFKDALGNKGEIHVSNSTKITPAFQFADRNIETPLIYDENYIPFLLDYCKKNNINAIISLFDIDLLVLSRNKKLFESIGTKVIVSNEAIIRICNDKYETYKFLRKNNIKTPKTFININEAIQSLRNGEITFPVIIKPRWGMGSIGIFEADNEEELNVLYKKVLREIQKSYLKYESNNIENKVLIQEKISGQEFGLDIINDLKGNYQNTIPKKKYAMRSGETDCAEIVQNDALMRLGETLSIALKHLANLDVDVFISNNIPYVLEMNARFGGGYPFSHQAGVNLPLAIVKWLKGVEPNPIILQPKVGVLSHKDIVIEQINKKKVDFPTTINRIHSLNEIKSILYKFDKVFTPTISSRITNLSEYATKLHERAYVYAAIDSEDEVVGFCAFYANDEMSRTSYITFLGVLPSLQNNSLGQSLLDKCLDISRDNRMEFVRLEVQKDNKKAIKFYRKNSFEFLNENTSSHFMLKRIENNE